VANILRGPVDAADFKTYIIPLLFFKRLSGVYDEEVKKAMEQQSGFAVVMKMNEIRTNHANLSIRLYVRINGSGIVASSETPAKAIAGWHTTSRQLRFSPNCLIARLDHGRTVQDGDLR
jgi:hypothetical protein